MQIQGNTGDRSFCLSNLTPITHLHLVEAGPLQPRKRWFPNILDQQKGICLSPVLSDRSNLKKIQLDQVTLIAVTSGWQTQSWYPRLLHMSIKNPLLLPSTPNNFDRAKQTKSSVDRKIELATPGMDSFREKLSAEGLSEEPVILIANSRRPGATSHRSGVSKIAGVVGEKMIPLDVLWGMWCYI